GRTDWNEPEARQAQAELDATLQVISKATNLAIDKIVEPLLVFMTSSGLSLDEIKGKAIWNRFIRFMNQSGANITNNIQFLRELKKDTAAEQFDKVSSYFVSFGLSLYLPKIFAAFTNSAFAQRDALVKNFNAYYSVYTRGREPDKNLLSKELIEEIHFATAGSTNLDRQTYRSTSERFKDKQIPAPNFQTSFKLRVASGELVLTGVTQEEEDSIRRTLQRLRGISQRAPPEFIADILSNLYSTYLKSDPQTLPEHVRKFVLALRADQSIVEQLNTATVNVGTLQQAIAAYLSRTTQEFDYATISREILQRRPGDNPEPSDPQIRDSLDKMIGLSLILQPHLRQALNAISPDDPLSAQVLFTLSEGLSELKPEAPALQERINNIRIKPGANRADMEANRADIVKMIARYVKTQDGKGFIELEFIPAKTSLDYFYGYFGENCTSSNPEELLNPNFTPLRIIYQGSIFGVIHTLTLNIAGEKSLVICGIEPQTPLANQLDPKNFVEGLLNKLVTEVAARNGYKRVLAATTDATQSNRQDTILPAIKTAISGKSIINQQVQATFPQGTSYSIENLAVWADNIQAASSSPTVAPTDTMGKGAFVSSAVKTTSVLLSQMREEGPLPLIERPKKEGIESAFNKYINNQVLSSEDIEIIIRQAIYENRMSLMAHLPEITLGSAGKVKFILGDQTMLAGRALALRCGPAASDITKRLYSLGGDRIRVFNFVTRGEFLSDKDI
ncbi:MAG: hypothetical protein WCL25_05570, partial [bacterium]